jgi:hypothetical protein
MSTSIRQDDESLRYRPIRSDDAATDANARRSAEFNAISEPSSRHRVDEPLIPADFYDDDAIERVAAAIRQVRPLVEESPKLFRKSDI